MRSTTIPIKLPLSYKNYFDYLSEETGIPKKTILETSTKWCSEQLKNNHQYQLNPHESSLEKETITVSCTMHYKKLLDDLVTKLNTTRYDLLISLIIDYHKLIDSDLYNLLSYEEYKA